MKNLIFKGDLVTADFEEKTMTFEIENDMVVQAGNYTIVRTEDYEKLVNGVNSKHDPALNIAVVNNRRELFDNFYKWHDSLTVAESDEHSLTSAIEEYFFKIIK